MDIKLDANSDIDVSSGSMVLLSGKEAIRQHLLIRLRFFLRDWFLDQAEGIPYFEDILIKNPQTNVIRAIFEKVILGTPGVSAITSLNMDLDIPTRVLSLSFVADTDTEGTLNFSERLLI